MVAQKCFGVNPKLAVFKGQEAGFSDIVWLRIASFERTMWIQKGEVIMAFILEIPEDILDTLKVPRERAVQEIKKELAFLLYQRGLASMGVARRLAGMDKWAFLEGLAERGFVRHYTEKELQEDIDYARSGE